MLCNVVDDTKVEKQVCNIVTSSNTSWGSAGTETWYAVTEDVTISERVIVSGTVNLILCDGKKLTASKRISVGTGQTFNIYGQSKDSGELVAETAYGVTGLEPYPDDISSHDAAIGGNNGTACGTLNIYGGKVTATSTAVSHDASKRAYSGGAGIGAGHSSDGGTVIISGGDVTAIGGENGGAGIGAGSKGDSYGGAGGIITITGGTVKARGGREASGIGAGKDGTTSVNYPNSKLKISGGTIEATGGDGGPGISFYEVDITETAAQPIFAFGGEPDGA